MQTKNELVLAWKFFFFLVEAMKQRNDAFIDGTDVIIKDKHFKYPSSSYITGLLLVDLSSKEWCRNVFPSQNSEKLK